MLKDNKSAKLNVLKVKEKWSDLLSFSSSKFVFTQIEFPFILSQLFIMSRLITPKLFKILLFIKATFALVSSRHVIDNILDKFLIYQEIRDFQYWHELVETVHQYWTVLIYLYHVFQHNRALSESCFCCFYLLL